MLLQIRQRQLQMNLQQQRKIIIMNMKRRQMTVMSHIVHQMLHRELRQRKLLRILMIRFRVIMQLNLILQEMHLVQLVNQILIGIIAGMIMILMIQEIMLTLRRMILSQPVKRMYQPSQLMLIQLHTPMLEVISLMEVLHLRIQ